MFLKICFRDNSIELTKYENIANKLKEIFKNVNLQTIDNSNYLHLVREQCEMKWKVIIDIEDCSYDDCMRISELIQCNIEGNSLDNKVDFYLVENISYNQPVDRAEVITSCYLWNYQNEPEDRNKYLLEHFEMEKKQKYYNYVAFQIVEKVATSWSPQIDFFFIAHVTCSGAINYIYSQKTLEEMRQHSMSFLDISTRQLSFGRTKSIYGGMENGV